uniref:Uncharacterized protein n=1 Tax=Romanomermis culicivorax TaxID=13658 RepID=A0A915HDP4_ROMCU
MNTIGGRQYLSDEEELLLVKLIHSLAFVGMPLSKDYLLAIVDDYIRKNKPKSLNIFVQDSKAVACT